MYNIKIYLLKFILLVVENDSNYVAYIIMWEKCFTCLMILAYTKYTMLINVY